MNVRLSEQQAIEIKRRHRNDFFSRPGVCGVGIEHDSRGPLLVVHVDRNAAAPQDLPKEVEGLRVSLQMSGPFDAQVAV